MVLWTRWCHHAANCAAPQHRLTDDARISDPTQCTYLQMQIAERKQLQEALNRKRNAGQQAQVRQSGVKTADVSHTVC